MANTQYGFESDKSAARVAVGTSFIEGLTGLGAIALAIIGLAGVFPRILLGVATIALGAALLFEAGSVAARFSALMALSSAGSNQGSRYGGITAGFLAGAAGIALGILALLGIVPLVLVPIAVIAFGVSMIMDSGVNVRLSTLENEASGSEGLSREVARESAAASTGIQVLAGLGAITLGIIALTGINPLVLSLIGMLITGAALLLSGSVVGGKMVGFLKS